MGGKKPAAPSELKKELDRLKLALAESQARILQLEAALTQSRPVNPLPDPQPKAAPDPPPANDLEQAPGLGEEKFRLAFQTNPDPCCITRARDGAFVEVNESFLTVSGYTRQEVMASNSLALNLYPDPAVRQQLVDDVRTQGLVRNREVQFTTKDGSLISTLMSLSVFMLHGEPHILSNIKVINDLRAAQRALEASEERYRRIVETAQEGIWVLDCQFRTTFVNQRMADMLGYTPADMLGRDVDGFMPPEELADFQAHRAERARGFGGNFERRFRHKDGGELIFQASASPLFDREGQFAGSFAMFSDITQRKRAEQEIRRLNESLGQQVRQRTASLDATVADLQKEIAERKQVVEALRQSEERYRQLVESSNEGIVVAQDGAIKFFNSHMLELTGLSAQEYTSRPFIEHVHPDDQDRILDRHQNLLQVDRTPNNDPFRIIDKQGRIKWLRPNAVTIEWQGRPATLNFFTDITELKQAEEALHESENRYRLLTDHSLTGVYIHQGGRFVYVNQRLAEILSAPKDSILQRNFWEFVHPDDRQMVKERGEARSRGELVDPANYVFRVVRPDGSERWLEVLATTIHLANGPANIGNVMDITERRQTEEALFKRDRMTQDILESLPGIFYTISQAGSFLRWNRNLEQVTGYSAEEMRRLSPLDLFEGPDRELIRSRIGEVFVKGNATAEAELIAKGGARTPYAFTGARVELDGQPCLVGMGMDITKRRQFEEALQESQRRLAQIVDFLPDATFVIDRRGEVIAWNQAMEMLTGVRGSDILGKGDYEYALLFYGLRRPVLIDLVTSPNSDISGSYASFTKERERLVSETCLPNFRGKGPTWLWNTASPLYDKDGEVVGAIESIRDITQRKLAEEAFRASERRYRELLDGISDFVYTHDLRGCWLTINQAACQSLGYSSENLLGQKMADLMPPAIRQGFYDEYLPSVISQGQASGVTKYLDADGRVHYMEYRNHLVQDEGREPFVRGSARDVTERIMAEREMRRLEEQLVQAQKMEAVGVLAGGVAHDFNNILQVISGFVQLMLQDKEIGSRPRESLSRVDQSVHRAADLVQRLLTFSRKAEKKTRVLDLNRTIDQAVKLIERTIPKMIHIELKLAPDIKPITVDPTQMEQVIVNLATNARDAMPEGGALTITTNNVSLSKPQARNTLDMPPGDYVLLKVSDTGVGMESQTLEHIFEPFFTTKDIGQGTGLGLAMVYGIVKGHGGHITCDSRAGQGTSFSIFLPASPGQHLNQSDQSQPLEAVQGGNETILLVDDEEAILTTAREALESYGYSVLTADTGEKALKICGHAGVQVDLVILDLSMPGMGGRRCLSQMVIKDPRVRVLVATGYADEVVKKEIDASGAKGIINKPYRFIDLLSTVRAVLDRE